MWFGLGKGSGDGLASIQRDMALQGLRAAGLSKAAATLVVDAGYSSAGALRTAPWAAEDAGGLHQSAEWRLSATAGSTAALLAEVRGFRDAASRTAGRETLPTMESPPAAPAEDEAEPAISA